MEFTNKKRTKIIKRTFSIVILALIISALFFLVKEMDLYAAITGGSAFLLMFLVPATNMNYVEYSSEGDQVVIRYYPIITVMTSKEYNSIEFKKAQLHKAEIKKNFLFSDLYIYVKTKQGVAEYPEVSLSGLSKKHINAIKEDLVLVKE